MVDFLGISCASKFMDNSKSAAEFKPTAGVRRILAAAGVNPSEKEAYWLGWHMEKSVKHARMHCELLDLPVAINAYLASRRVEVPPPEAWHLAQAKQAVDPMGSGRETFKISGAGRGLGAVCGLWKEPNFAHVPAFSFGRMLRLRVGKGARTSRYFGGAYQSKSFWLVMPLISMPFSER
jgi:hypothetical protein